MEYNDRKADLLELASYDNASGYDIDEGGIYLDKEGKIVFLSASGCSCWDGDFEEKVFDSLAELEIALIRGDKDGNDVLKYQPGLERGKQLIEEARKKLPKSWAAAAQPVRIQTVGELADLLDGDSERSVKVYVDGQYRNIKEVVSNDDEVDIIVE